MDECVSAWVRESVNLEHRHTMHHTCLTRLQFHCLPVRPMVDTPHPQTVNPRAPNCCTSRLQMDWSLQQRVEVDAPSHLQLPTGSTVPIDYSGAQPKARVKLQEVFGLADMPLLGGRGVGVPLLLELLSPAGRPLQVCLCRRGGPAGTVGEMRTRVVGARVACIYMHACLSQHRSTQYGECHHHQPRSLCPALPPTHALTHTHTHI